MSDPRLKFRKVNLKQWKSILKEIFPNEMPARYKWTKRDDIIRILKKLGSIKGLNHTFFPSGGGLDLIGVNISTEPDCIELYFDGSVKIIKPDYLSFHSFGPEEKYLEWAYFRLETKTLKPTGIYKRNVDFIYEPLLEVSPGKYTNISYWEQGFLGYDENGEEIEIPDTARLVTRYLEGSFVIFAKGSIYNQINETYDARHNKVSNEEFEKHIAEVVKKLKEKECC